MCVIFCADLDSQRCLGKVRDRNYDPKLELRHEVIDGVEVCYLVDLETNWLEGLNEFGVGVVNSALMVQSDEKEHAKSKQVGSVSKDGVNILSALAKTSLRESLGSMIYADVKGHTIISDPHVAYMIETTSQHGLVYSEISDLPHYRTNHGMWHSSAGYDSESNDGNSSRARMSASGNAIMNTAKPEDVMLSIRKASGDFGWRSAVRNTEKMRTSSMMLLNCSRLHVTVYLHPDNVTSFKAVGSGNKITTEVIWTKPLGKRHPISEGLVDRIDRLVGL